MKLPKWLRRGKPKEELSYFGQLLVSVKEPGWFIPSIFADESSGSPAFAYTIGLWHNYKHPELIIVGMPDDVGGAVLNLQGYLIRDEGRQLIAGQSYDDVIDDYAVQCVEAPRPAYETWALSVIWFYEEILKEEPAPVLQIVWPSLTEPALYPWDEGWDEVKPSEQPILADLVKLN